jgi:8-oxo-dGTP diphosphatase
MDEYIFCHSCSAKLVTKIIDDKRRKHCEKCGFTFWNNPKPVVSVLIQRNGKILMLQRANEPFKDYWVLPGGFMCFEETAEEAVKRETKEETGLDVKIERIIGIYRIDNDPRGMHVDIIYKGKADGKIKLSQEDGKYNYFAKNSLPEHIAYKHRTAIEDWIKKSNQYG